jgi:hypothetical protein
VIARRAQVAIAVTAKVLTKKDSSHADRRAMRVVAATKEKLFSPWLILRRDFFANRHRAASPI